MTISDMTVLQQRHSSSRIPFEWESDVSNDLNDKVINLRG